MSLPTSTPPDPTEPGGPEDPDRFRLVRVASTAAMINLVDNCECQDPTEGGARQAIGVFSPDFVALG